MQLCPCQSGKLFSECCQPYISFTVAAPSPEALMRSRYTAFALANVEYIEKTMRGVAAQGFNRAGTLKFASESEWLGLDIVHSYQHSDEVGYVEFVAHYNDGKGYHQHLAELSEFHKEEGHWYYVDGQPKKFEHHHGEDVIKPFKRSSPKIGRNDPCTCGSGKKFKKCCGG